jgi:hypothetical protein
LPLELELSQDLKKLHLKSSDLPVQSRNTNSEPQTIRFYLSKIAQTPKLLLFSLEEDQEPFVMKPRDVCSMLSALSET